MLFRSVDKKLDEAKNKVTEVGKRHRAVVHSLRNVEGVTLLEGEAPAAQLAAPLTDVAAE